MGRGASLREALLARGVLAWASVEWHETLVSTSDRLKALARAGAPEWTAVAAGAQTGGRGREGRAWVSPPGGLYLSVLLRPRFEAVSLVPLAAGVAVAAAVGELGLVAQLKWPNDVLVSGRKLAGILAESASGAGGVDWVALGIGVNVSIDVAATAPELQGLATSLAAEGVVHPSPDALAAAVLAHLRVWYDALGTRAGSVVEAWRARSAPWWGGLAEVRTAEGVVLARLSDVDETGALLLDLEDGGRRRVLSGEVVRLRAGAGRRERG